MCLLRWKASRTALADIDTNYHHAGGGFWGGFIREELAGTIADKYRAPSGSHPENVCKEFRGKEYGIAQQLLEELVAYSKSVQITDLYLGTVDKLAAAAASMNAIILKK